MNQSVVIIPFDENEVDDVAPRPVSSSNPDVDFVDGALLRLDAYKAVWSRCASRIRGILDKLYAPVVQDVSRFLLDDRPRDDSALQLEVEIPTALLISTDQSTISVALWKALDPLLSEENDSSSVGDGELGLPRGVVVRLAARACSTLASTLKIVTKSLATQLGRYISNSTQDAEEVEDMRGVAALYQRAFGDASDTHKPHIILTLEEIESFDPLILQDLLELLAYYAPRLPFRLLFTLSTTAGYLQTAMPRAALIGLKTECFQAPTGEVVSEHLIRGLYFDPSFEPLIALGPIGIHALRELSTLYATPAAGLTSALQVMHMYHFYDPRAVLSLPALGENEGDGEVLFEGRENWADYVRAALSGRDETLFALEPQGRLKRSYRSLYLGDTEDLAGLVAVARGNFHEMTRRTRSAVMVLLAIREHCATLGLRVWEPRMRTLDVYQAALEGRLRDVVNNAVTLVKRMEFQQLQDLLEVLHTTCDGWPQHVRREEKELRQDIVVFKNLGEDEEALADFGVKLEEYFKARLVKMSDLALYDALCLDGVVDYAMDLINPTARSGITAALMQPMTWLEAKLELPEHEAGTTKAQEAELVTYPDASILFLRSLEAGKKINLLDWFESFSMAVEKEAEHFTKQEETPSPRKRRRAKVNGKQVNGPRASGKSAEEEAEEREQELQVRFVRSVQELEYVGILKHSARRTDFAVRTLFETVD
ncbi:hypothetical protein DACRYDRAFT_13546 [Dacryopinax primogenitus]|uniref:Uncharacterized protein n=1 Tax=Dacryopinax primogenitus (strain DJM 731) TaxID=1858805 RepID=M5GEP2_DACPD|nr:uncharacterized protein DACRYDRAFT_13546 [Dacryopinax primogenitus]EJU05577.1 hypothetical protein DACRYDRAFT_13546 [Dacryopinax primogenitus]